MSLAPVLHHDSARQGIFGLHSELDPDEALQDKLQFLHTAGIPILPDMEPRHCYLAHLHHLLGEEFPASHISSERVTKMVMDDPALQRTVLFLAGV